MGNRCYDDGVTPATDDVLPFSLTPLNIEILHIQYNILVYTYACVVTYHLLAPWPRFPITPNKEVLHNCSDELIYFDEAKFLELPCCQKFRQNHEPRSRRRCKVTSVKHHLMRWVLENILLLCLISSNGQRNERQPQEFHCDEEGILVASLLCLCVCFVSGAQELMTTPDR